MAKLSMLQFLRNQCVADAPVPVADLTGKTVVVVGANIGLGFEASKHLVKLGASRVILACRNLEKSKSALDAVREVAGPKSIVELWKLDLGDFSSVVQFVERFEKDGGRLDVLLANAAVATDKYEATKNGWESTIQVNHLATSLLSLLLIPALVQTAKRYGSTPRLCVVSSEVHFWATLDKRTLESPKILETLSSKEYCTPAVMANRYVTSKLLNVFFVRALNKHLPSTSPLIVNTVNPGYCYSGLRRSLTFPASLFDWLMEKLLARSTELGSRQLVWAAVDVPEEKKGGEALLRGAYVSNVEVAEVADFVLSDVGGESEKRVWNETIEILSKVSPKVKAVVDNYLIHA